MITMKDDFIFHGNHEIMVQTFAHSHIGKSAHQLIFFFFSNRKTKSEVQHHFISPKSLFCRSLINFQTGISRVVKFVGVFEKYIFEECCTKGTFYSNIPSANLKTRVILFPEKTIFYMWDQRSNSCLPQKIYFNVFIFRLVNIPAFDNIKKQKIRAIIQVIEKTISLAECDGTVNRFAR